MTNIVTLLKTFGQKTIDQQTLVDLPRPKGGESFFIVPSGKLIPENYISSQTRFKTLVRSNSRPKKTVETILGNFDWWSIYVFVGKISMVDMAVLIFFGFGSRKIHLLLQFTRYQDGVFCIPLLRKLTKNLLERIFEIYPPPQVKNFNFTFFWCSKILLFCAKIEIHFPDIFKQFICASYATDCIISIS